MENHSMYLVNEQRYEHGTICSQILVALPLQQDTSSFVYPSTSTAIVPSSSMDTSNVQVIEEQNSSNTILSHPDNISSPSIQDIKMDPSSSNKEEFESEDIKVIKLDNELNVSVNDSNSSLNNSSSNSPLSTDNVSTKHDTFCFVCHRINMRNCKGTSKFFHCETCPNSVHRLHYQQNWTGKCKNCSSKEDAKTNSMFKVSKKLLNEILVYTVGMLQHDVVEFDSYLEKAEKSNKIFNPIRFKDICKKVKDEKYNFIEEFQYDIRLLEHNLLIRNGSFNTIVSRFMARYQDELNDILTCYHCYLNFYKTDPDDEYFGFNLPCPIGHPVVWIYNEWFRVYWPAKAMKLINHKFSYEFRFFGKRKMEVQKGNLDSDKILCFSKNQPKKNAELFRRFALADKEGINLKKELQQALKCVENYHKAFEVDVPTDPKPIIDEIKNLKPRNTNQKINLKRNRSQSPQIIASTSASASGNIPSISNVQDDNSIISTKTTKSTLLSSISDTDSELIPEDDDCVFLKSSSSDKNKPREPIKMVINTKTNIIKPVQKDLKDMNYNDILANDPELRDCVKTLHGHLEKVMKNIEFFNEHAFSPKFPTVRQLYNTIEDHVQVISKFPKRVCDSCQRKEVDLKYFCCQYGIYCCEYCQKDDKGHSRFCLKKD